MTIVIIAILFIVILEILRRRLLYHKKYLDISNLVQSSLTTLAILIAGYWFFVERKGAPHADIEEKIAVIPSEKAGQFAIVEATITVKNLGQQLLRIRNVDVRLQTADLDQAKARAVAELGPTEWPQQLANGTHLFNEAEYQWPTLRWFRQEVDHEVEPGESDMLTATFVVPCSIQNIRIAAQIEKGSSGILFWRTPSMFWKARSFASTEQACKAEPG
jgi:hypothetical protein